MGTYNKTGIRVLIADSPVALRVPAAGLNATVLITVESGGVINSLKVRRSAAGSLYGALSSEIMAGADVSGFFALGNEVVHGIELVVVPSADLVVSVEAAWQDPE